MAIPFLWELRAILDWTVETTSLSLFEWLKLEDVYAGLCAVRADMNSRRRRVADGRAMRRCDPPTRPPRRAHFLTEQRACISRAGTCAARASR